MTAARSDITVYTRDLWSGAWVEQPYLRPLRAVSCCSPEMPVAEFEYEYGRIRHEDETSTSDISPLDILDAYVLIEDSTGEIRWIGVVTDVQTSHEGADGAEKSGRQRFTARGLEHLLDRSPVRGAWADQDGDGFELVDIDWTPAFNVRSATGGSVLGNRSETRIVSGLDQHWAFSEFGAVWTYANALEYLLDRHAPQSIMWALSGQYADFDSGTGVPLVVDVSGLTVKQALDALIDRRRGYSWCLRYDKVYDTMRLHVFSGNPSDIVVGTVTFGENGEQDDLDVNGARDAKSVIVRRERSASYDSIHVEGARVKSCFTIAMLNGTIEAGWEAALATAYKAGVSALKTGYANLINFEQAKLNDDYRKNPAFARCYQFFRTPPGWMWSCGSGGTAPYLANPAVDDDGYVTSGAGVRCTLPRPMLDWLPLQEGVDYGTAGYPSSNPSGAQPVFRKPFAILKDQDGRYVFAHVTHDGELPTGQFAAADRENGFYVRFPTPHSLAKNHWTGSPEPTEVEPSFDYDDLIVTVCAPTDERLAVRAVSSLPVADFERVLVIRVEDAECWFVAEGTVVDIDGDGALVTIANGPALLRTDAPRLRQIAAQAVAWYGIERAALPLTWDDLRAPLDVGQLVTTLNVSDFETVTLNSLVTRISWDFEQLETTLQTGWYDVDWASVVPVNQPGLPTPKAMAARMTSVAIAGGQIANYGGG